MTETEKQDFIGFLTEFINESDRAAVVLGAAKLDYLLYKLLKKVFLPAQNKKKDELLGNEGFGGILGSFHAKINIAYRLGLLDKSFRDTLHLIRNIRNPFAHEPEGGRLDANPYSSQINTLCLPYRELPIFSEGVKIIQKTTQEKLKKRSVEFRVALALITARLQQAIIEVQPLISDKPFGLISEYWLTKKADS